MSDVQASRGVSEPGAQRDVPVLQACDINAGYGRVQVLRRVSVTVDSGEIVALLGANGSGKSTLLKALVGLVRVTEGAVLLDGSSPRRTAPESLLRAGIALVPEGRLLFADLTVADNLRLGAYTAERTAVSARLDEVTSLFPVLAERATQLAATLSGGEQQMLAIGRALMAGPRVLLLDEPSLGLAPRVVREILATLDTLRARGLAIVLAEQDARLALAHADRGYVMRTGAVALSGTAQKLIEDDAVQRIYLGSWQGEDGSVDDLES